MMRTARFCSHPDFSMFFQYPAVPFQILSRFRTWPGGCVIWLHYLSEHSPLMKFRFLLMTALLSMLALNVAYGQSSVPIPSAQAEKNKAKLLQTKSCPSCDLSRVTLNRADLKGANLQGANLSGARLLLADLTKANLKNADLRNASLAAADLSGANLEGADLDGADLAGVFFDADYKPPAAAAAKAQSRGGNIRRSTTLAAPKETAPAPPTRQEQLAHRGNTAANKITVSSTRVSTISTQNTNDPAEDKNASPPPSGSKPKTSISEATNRALASSTTRSTTARASGSRTVASSATGPTSATNGAISQIPATAPQSAASQSASGPERKDTEEIASSSMLLDQSAKAEMPVPPSSRGRTFLATPSARASGKRIARIAEPAFAMPGERRAQADVPTIDAQQAHAEPVARPAEQSIEQPIVLEPASQPVEQSMSQTQEMEEAPPPPPSTRRRAAIKKQPSIRR